MSILALPVSAEESSNLPVVVSKDQIRGSIFDGVEPTQHADGHITTDVTSLLSSDKKFASGMYRSGKTRIVVSEGYGVDEFMYFIEGGITLTNQDGTKQIVRAGEAVSVPKEWKGVFETDGYKKFWVIYSGDGSGL
ncbi:MAG: DUF861 domain-containing protein [Gammaproteobacteria bacterium]|nr:DUF861 domain-containing protein [Gammaproteobacteria bacterium]